jgi:hypothetical protein
MTAPYDHRVVYLGNVILWVCHGDTLPQDRRDS